MNQDIARLQQQVQTLVDDLEIRRLVGDYASLIDTRQWERLVDVFAPDVVVEYHNGRTVVTGAQQVVDYVVENTAHLAWQHHNVTTYGVTVDGDTASAPVYLLSHQMLRDDPSAVLMMAATYDMRFTRTDHGWRLAHMVHAIKVGNYVPIATQPPGGAHVPPAVRH